MILKKQKSKIRGDMMKRGFTLVELLMVVILLGMISLIAVPVVDKIIKENREKLYQTNVKMIEEGARSWASENVFLLPDEDGEFIELTICDLEKSGHLDVNIKNPKNDELFYKDSKVKIIKTKFGYEYQYNENSGTKEAVCN